MPFRRIATLACSLLIASTAFALGGQSANAPMPSPPATANVTLGGKAISIQYNAPSLRGRHIGSADFVPYGKWWRTGANPATTLVTPTNLKIGTLTVPAGTYTIYTAAQRNPMAAHHQQADRPVGHRIQRRTRTSAAPQ